LLLVFGLMVGPAAGLVIGLMTGLRTNADDRLALGQDAPGELSTMTSWPGSRGWCRRRVETWDSRDTCIPPMVRDPEGWRITLESLPDYWRIAGPAGQSPAP